MAVLVQQKQAKGSMIHMYDTLGAEREERQETKEHGWHKSKCI